MLALHPDLGVAIGIDTHNDTHTAAAVGATGAALEHLTVPGYRQLIGFGRRHGATLWAIEGTGSFGAGLTTALHACCERVVEVGRPQRPARRGGVKSDDIDAVRAARQVLAGVGLSPSVGCVHLTKEIPMATNLAAQAGTQPTTRSEARPLGQLLPGAAGLLYAGVQLEGGITAAVYRGISTVPDDRLSFPFSGSLATATSLTWGLTQALFVVTLLGFARSGAVGASRPGRIGAWLALVGGIVIVAAHAVSVIFRDARVDDPAGLGAITLFAIATVLTAIGFIVAGVAVARAGRWTAWRRYPVLAVGVWMLCMLPLQFTSLLPLSVAVYAATITAFAVALLAQPERGKE